MLGTLVRLYRGIQELRNQVIEDWTVNSRDWTMPGFRAIAVHRLGTWLANRRSGVVKSGLLAVYRVLYRYVRNHYGIEIPLTVTIGRRLWGGIWRAKDVAQGSETWTTSGSGPRRGDLCRSQNRRRCGHRPECGGDVGCSGRRKSVCRGASGHTVADRSSGSSQELTTYGRRMAPKEPSAIHRPGIDSTTDASYPVSVLLIEMTGRPS